MVPKSDQNVFHCGVVLELEILTTPFFDGLKKTWKNKTEFESILGAKTRFKSIPKSIMFLHFSDTASGGSRDRFLIDF